MSAFRVGDAVGMLAFDESERTELFVPARVSRGMGGLMASAVRDFIPSPRRVSDERAASRGLREAASHLAGRQGLIFLVSDFHWPLQRLDEVLDMFAHATVVPTVVWDPAETEPPECNALASLRDAESGARRTLWIRPTFRTKWRRAVAERGAEIASFFATHGLRPFYIEGAFDPDALSRYFFEADL